MLRKFIVVAGASMAWVTVACSGQIVVVQADDAGPQVDTGVLPDAPEPPRPPQPPRPTTDAMAVDAATDALMKMDAPVLHPDSGVPDGGLDADDPGTCSPANVSAFVPSWKAPRPHQNACTQMQINRYLTGCLGASSSSAQCTPFLTGAEKACGDCISSKATDPTLGPLVSHGGYVITNIPGCVALATNDMQGTGCTGKLLAPRPRRPAAPMD